jgi:hypothetical protein
MATVACPLGKVPANSRTMSREKGSGSINVRFSTWVVRFEPPISTTTAIAVAMPRHNNAIRIAMPPSSASELMLIVFSSRSPNSATVG